MLPVAEMTGASALGRLGPNLEPGTVSYLYICEGYMTCATARHRLALGRLPWNPYAGCLGRVQAISQTVHAASTRRSSLLHVAARRSYRAYVVGGLAEGEITSADARDRPALPCECGVWALCVCGGNACRRC